MGRLYTVKVLNFCPKRLGPRVSVTRVDVVRQNFLKTMTGWTRPLGPDQNAENKKMSLLLKMGVWEYTEGNNHDSYFMRARRVPSVDMIPLKDAFGKHSPTVQLLKTEVLESLIITSILVVSLLMSYSILDSRYSLLFFIPSSLHPVFTPLIHRSFPIFIYYYTSFCFSAVPTVC